MNNSRKITKQAMIAAMYVALSVALAPISYGAVQIRVSEALTLLPVFDPASIFAVTVGCFLSNLIGLFTGANILGALDIVFGTLATLVAAVLTYAFRNIKFKGLPILSAVPPIIINAVVIGLELCILINGRFNLTVFLAQALFVGIGQFLSCMILGLFMVRFINKSPKFKEIIEK